MSSNPQAFEHGRSAASEMFLATVAESKGCTCKAYVDWYTYRRWQALGFQVRKGEKGTSLPVYMSAEVTNAETHETTTKTFQKRTHVFCRCQVDAKEVTTQ